MPYAAVLRRHAYASSPTAPIPRRTIVDGSGIVTGPVNVVENPE
jgi:hypothetical protein